MLSSSSESGVQKAELQRIGESQPKLFYERYGLLENPFGMTPNPRYLYQSRTHAEARSSLVIGIEYRVGFQALIAPPGMGKTTILFSLLEQFGNDSTACLFQSQGAPSDFLRCLISELEGEAPDSDLVRMQETLNQLLIREHRAGRRTIVVIDEAQNLDISVLETVRLLSNFETPSEKLLQIILAGQPQLAQRLATPELAQLYQRIPIRTTLNRFDLEDTRNYIEHRLRVAGYDGPPLFTSAAVRSIFERSGGVPREINTLCFNALLLVTAAAQKQVDSDILREVVADLELDPIRFTEAGPRNTSSVQTADVPGLGDTPADLPATIVDNIRKAAVPGSKTDADDDIACAALSERPALSDSDFSFLSREKGACEGADENAKEVKAKDHKTDGVALSATEVAGASGGETEAAHNATELPLLTPNSVDPQGVNDATPPLHFSRMGTSSGLHEQGASVTDSRWITATADLAIACSLVIIGLFILSLMRGVNVGSPASKSLPAKSLAQQGKGNTQDGRGLLGDAALGRDKSPALPSIAVVLSLEDEPGSVSESMPTVVPGADLDRQARLVGNIVPARLIRMVKPVYPPTALKTQSQGDVVLHVMVDQNGVVRNVRFVSGPEIFASAAVDAVELWRYRPAQVDGQPLAWETSMTIKFSLR
jgi:TonB family protein